MKRLIYIFCALVLVVLAMVPASLKMSARSDLGVVDIATLTPQQRGIVRFARYDWGALNAATLRTNAMPWKLGEAALALQQAGDVQNAAALSVADVFRPFGFHVPARVANWPDGVPALPAGAPLGLVRGQSGGLTPLTLEIANMGCAACHSALVYDETGAPDIGAVWLGGTNASLNLDAYTQGLFDGLLGHTADDLMTVARARFPDMGLRERLTLRHVILPALTTQLQDRDAAMGALLPFSPSHIGATNGYDSLRLRLELIDLERPVAQSYFTSIPALGGRTWRSRLLASGVYSAPDTDHSAQRNTGVPDGDQRAGMAQMISYFTLPSMGVTPQDAIAQHEAAGDVVDWLAQYDPQPFPAPVDPVSAAQGQQIYAAHCSACHGTYDSSLTRPALTSFPNWEGDIGTDMGPPMAQLEPLTEAINSSEYAPYLTARANRMRSAPPLSGVWASAPYLANGSVPTLWHLMRPDTRPAEFAIGGHRLDMARVGVDLSPPAGYIPWSTPGLFDTATPGFSNAGHETPFETMSEADKDALLEYLKLL